MKHTGGRLVSLDALRGLTIAGMLLVNNPGSWAEIYPPLRHAAWHGWTPTDLIFPCFGFIVVSPPICHSRPGNNGATPKGRFDGRCSSEAGSSSCWACCCTGFPSTRCHA